MIYINEILENDFNPSQKVRLVLGTEDNLFYSHVKHPVLWSGSINSDKIEIFQKTDSAICNEDFIFKKFPEKYCEFKESVIKSIHAYLKIQS